MKWLGAFLGGSVGAFCGFFVGCFASCGRSSGTWGATFVFLLIGAVIGFFIGNHADQENEELRSHNQIHSSSDEAYWNRLPAKYSSSIRCKYCKFFEPGANRCHLYHDFDQSFYRGGEYYQSTTPNGRCSKFMLTAMDAIASGSQEKRPDGSYLVSLDDVM